ncbi:MAG TPA: histidine kinase [Candidatus Limnocylindrales bacterium]|nr:histidine kinase [Candidatus Limnocylindrales bacterium]
MSGTRPLVRRAATAVAIGFAVVTLLVHIDQGAPLQFLILETTLGALFLIAGFVAWERRPEVLTGPLLTLSGVIWFAGGYAATALEPQASIAWGFERYYDPILAFLALSFPGRRLVSPAARLLVGGLVVTFAIRTAFRFAFACACAPAPLDALAHESVLIAAEAATSAVIVVLSLGVAVLCVRRVATASPAAKPILRPVATAGILAALSAAYDAAELSFGIVTGQPLNALPDPWSEVVSWSIFVAVAMVPLGFMLGALRLHLRHGAIAPLALELDKGSDAAGLERALRSALGDPSLSLLLKDHDADVWRSSSGATTVVPLQTPGRTVTLLESNGEAIAAIEHDEALAEDPGLVAAATAVLRLAVENERLAADLRKQLDEVRASRARLVDTAQAERTRIERDLHDGAQQRLVSVAMMLQEALGEARRESPHSPFVQRLDDTSDELKSAIDELRELARGIHPALLTEEGLGVAVAALARRASVPVEVNVDLDGRLPGPVETTGYYVVAEALTNVARHARARSATVTVAMNGDSLEVEVADDGQGGTDVGRGTGLRGLADRLDAISGRLEIISPVGGGTRLRAVIPCA